MIKTLISPFRDLSYTTLNHIEIIEKNILFNVDYLQKLQPGKTLIPVLKSNAYGHGLAEVCRILNKTTIKMVAVDSFPEAQIVYNNSHKHVLLLSESTKDCYRYFNKNRTDFVVYNESTLRYLATLFKQPRIHLFINTGMNREGIKNLENFLISIKDILHKVKIVGCCTHFASADMISGLNEKQENNFFASLQLLHSYNIFPEYIHAGNSAGVFILKNSRYTAFRPGLAIYGYNVFPPDHPAYPTAEKLLPSLKVISTVIAIQHIKKGEIVSYAETYKAKNDTNIAVIPFGYYEGLDRRLSNSGKILINNSFFTIAGRVCMNISCIDIKNNDHIKLGDKVIILSDKKNDKNSIDRTANLLTTIPYEVLVKLNPNIRRIIVNK